MARIVEIQRLEYTYPGGRHPALRLEELSLDEGQVIWLAGPNGAGKTTLCRLLSGLIPHFFKGTLKGSLRIQGRDSAGLSLSEIAGQVGYVMDDPFDQLSHATDTVWEEIAFGLQNVGLPPEEIFRRLEQTMQELGITALAERAPNTLSGGEQQRVAIASIFARQPAVLVLDEATSQLDPQGSEAIFQLVRHFRETGKTVVVAEPRADKISQIADRVLLLEKGRLSAQGTAAEVLACGAFEKAGLSLPSYPQLARRLEQKGLYQGPLPVHLAEARRMVEEVQHARR